MEHTLFTTTDPRGYTVILTESCYAYHILVEHPDISDIDEIEQTIRNPHTISRDAIDDERLIYYRIYRRNPKRWMIKVVVGDGEVITAYRVTRMKKGETIIWRR